MGVLHDVALGFSTAFSLHNLLFCLVGVVLGTVIGLLPGLGSATGVALLLPVTFTLPPVTAMIMLAGIYYGCQYGSSISSTLISTPGDSASAVITFEGYPLARRGLGGRSIAISAISSFVSGTLTVIPLMALAPVFVGFALHFGPPETFALVLLGMLAIVGFTGRSPAKGLAMGAFGVALAMIGLDPQTGIARFSFGQVQLYGGIGFVPVIIGLFAVSEVLNQVGRGGAKPIRTRMRDMLVTRGDLRQVRWSIPRGGVTGFFIGVLPGAGATLASFFAYEIERRVSKHKERFGKGALEGVAAPEAANNAAANAAFVPTLTLGIPGSETTAILLGAFLIFGIQPGPLLFTHQPALVWGLMASFYIGNVFLLVLNLPFAPLLASILRLRYAFLYPLILFLALIGAYSIQNRMWNVWLALAFGLIGYFMRKYDYPAPPVILGLILGGLMEKNLVQTSQMAGGNLMIFFHRPIALALFAIGFAVLLGPYAVKAVRRLAGSAPPPALQPSGTGPGNPSGDTHTTTTMGRESS
ncbi:MAG: tripartite tricarboxylate transporter permease [Streptosporangiaceae bacterium]